MQTLKYKVVSVQHGALLERIFRLFYTTLTPAWDSLSVLRSINKNQAHFTNAFPSIDM